MTRRGYTPHDENDDYGNHLQLFAYAEEWRPRPVMVASEPLGLNLKPEDEARRQELRLRLDCSYQGGNGGGKKSQRPIPRRPAELTVALEVEIDRLRSEESKKPAEIAKMLGVSIKLVEPVHRYHGALVQRLTSTDSYWYGERPAPKGWRCPECGHKATWMDNGVCRACFLRCEAKYEKVLAKEINDA